MIFVDLPDLPPPDVNVEKRFLLNGIELADDAMIVTPYGVVMVRGLDLDGWDGATDSTGGDSPRAYRPGSVPSQYPQASPRVLTLKMTLLAESPAAMRHTMDLLNQAVTLTDFLFVHDEWGLRRTVTARRQGAPQTDRTEAAVVKGWSCTLRCADPRKYGDLVTVSTGLPFTSGGLVFPATFPVTSNAVSGTGVASFYNAGGTDAPVLGRIYGPVPRPKITHVGAHGPELWAYGGYVPAGNWLDVDFDNRRVLENGVADRGQLVVARGWFSANPGANDFAFQSDLYDAAARLEITTAPAWE